MEKYLVARDKDGGLAGSTKDQQQFKQVKEIAFQNLLNLTTGGASLAETGVQVIQDSIDLVKDTIAKEKEHKQALGELREIEKKFDDAKNKLLVCGDEITHNIYAYEKRKVKLYYSLDKETQDILNKETSITEKIGATTFKWAHGIRKTITTQLNEDPRERNKQLNKELDARQELEKNSPSKPQLTKEKEDAFGKQFQERLKALEESGRLSDFKLEGEHVFAQPKVPNKRTTTTSYTPSKTPNNALKPKKGGPHK